MLQSDTIVVNHATVGEEVVGDNTSSTVEGESQEQSQETTEVQEEFHIDAPAKANKSFETVPLDSILKDIQEENQEQQTVDMSQFSLDSLLNSGTFFRTEMISHRQGVAGDPLPYTIAGDNFMSIILLAAFIFVAVAFSRSRGFISRQVKSFFYMQRGNTTTVTETSTEVRFQLILILVACLMLAVLYFIYLQERVTDTFTISQSRMIAMFTGIFAAYFLVKYILYQFVNWVFFERKNIQQWTKSNLFLTATEGIFLLPLVFIRAFFNLPFGALMTYLAIVLVFFKLLAIYKQYQIFFTQKGPVLQIFLYFCALELTPLFSLWSILTIISGYLKINF